MSSTTGILSLSVHEAFDLTFEGCEIALHPSLFAASPATAASGVASNSASASITVADDGDSSTLLNTPVSLTKSKSAVAAAASQKGKQTKQSKIGLEVGDMIEIRVWTPKPKQASSTGSHGSSHHHGTAGTMTRHHRYNGSILGGSFRGTISPTRQGGRFVIKSPRSANTSIQNTVSGSPAVSDGAQPQTQQQSSAPASPSGQSNEESRTLASSVGSEDSLIMTQLPQTKVSESDTSGGVRQIVMRRDGSSASALAVEPADIKTPVLSEGGRAASGGAEGGVDSMASSLSSSPHLSLGGGPSGSTAVPAPPMTLPTSGNLPPLPPSRQSSLPPRSRTNTADNVSPSKTLPPRGVGSSSAQEAPETPLTAHHGNRGRINTLPTDIAKASSGAEQSLSPRKSDGMRTLTTVDATPGHVRDISKLSVGSDFMVTPMMAQAMGHHQHMRDASSLSSGVGGGRGQLQVATADAGRIARSLMLNASQGSVRQQTPGMFPGKAALVQTGPFDNTLNAIRETHDEREMFVMMVTKKTLTSIKSSARTQVSILKQVADLYHLSPYDRVTVTKVAAEDEKDVLEEVSADFILVTFKDQFISRGEMYQFQHSLIGRWLYEGVRLDSSADGIRANAVEIRHAQEKFCSGIVTENTKITFRSRSTRIIWLLQISSEMFEYAPPVDSGASGGAGGMDDDGCEIYFDKFVTFMHRLFAKWKELEVTHSLTVVFFSRTFSRQEQDASSGGKGYEDHYKMVIENKTQSDWASLVCKIKKAFVRYPIEVGWHLNAKAGRVPSTASQGNLLEAINITLNLLSLHYADRDLHRTGNSIVVISAGSGVFEVDKGLASITKQRMMDNGIGSDMLSLTLPPLHIAPFFLFDVESTAKEETPEFDDWKGYFEIPHWMHLSFLSYDNEVIPNNTTSAAPGVSMNMISPLVQPPAVAANGGTCFPNGFVVRVPAEVVTNETPRQPTASGLEAEAPTGKSHSQRQQRHLISSRNFEDILEACRPRNRGDTLSAFPSALALLVPNNAASTAEDDGAQIKSEAADDAAPNVVSDERGVPSPQIDAYKSSDLEPVSEWGAINFETAGGESLAHIAEGSSSISPAGVTIMEEYVHRDKTRAGSDKSSSPSSSFSSHHSSMFFGRSLERSPDLLSSSFPLRGDFGFGQGATALQIQPSSDLPLPLLADAGTPDDHHQHLIRHNSVLSEDSLSTMASEDRRKNTMQVDKSVEALKKMMLSYDTNMFVPPTPDHAKVRGGADEATKHDRHDARDAVAPGRLTQQHNVGALSPLGEQTTSVSGFNASSRSMNQTQGGGIGAALHHFDGSKVAMITKRRSSVQLDRAHLTTPFFGGPASFGNLPEVDAAPSPSLLESVGMPLGSDPPDIIRPAPSTYARVLNHSSQGGRQGPLRAGESTTSLGIPGAANGRRISLLTSAEPSPNSDNRKMHGHDQGVSQHKDARPRSHSPTKTSQRHHNSHHSSHHASHHNSHHRHHHHRHGGSKHKGKGKSKSQRNQHAAHTAPAPSSQASRRKAWVLNPFRQEDEDEVLAKKTHNRRRWSHVFPPGEIEFKRHAGPNWRSLSQPAILPTTIDYHPSPQELDDPARFQFNHYSVSLEAMEDTGYKSHKELLREMVRQRLIQDYQIVPHSIIMKSRTHKADVERKRGANTGVSTIGPFLERGVPVRPGLLSGLRPTSARAALPPQRALPSADDDLQHTHTLSMGHRIQLLSYNHDEDTIEVKQYFSRLAMSDQAKHPYQYSLWCPVQQKYVKVWQEFKKYGDEYLWNKVDNTIVCGDGEMRLFEGSRYRRIMFRILPDEDIMGDPKKEADYVKKFQRLLDYIGKQLLDTTPDQLGIKILTSADAKKEANKRRMSFDNRHFRVPLKKGSAERNQWMEMLIDSTFDTRTSYKIMLNWLVASAVQVGAQVKLLQRRCAQYGLRLISFPQDSVTGGVQLHPFIAPILIHIRDKEAVDQVELSIYSLDFIDDCMIPMETAELEKESNDYEFPVSRFGRRRLKAPSKQYVHLSGTLFCRIVRDMKGRGIVIVYENRRYVSGNVELTKKARIVFVQLKGLLASCMGKDSVDDL